MRLFAVGEPFRRDRLWLSPNPGSLDLLPTFEEPSPWKNTRRRIDVFALTQQHTYGVADVVAGPNTYDALVRVEAFGKLRQWKIETVLGVAVVKEHYCPDAQGIQRAVPDTLAAVQATRRQKSQPPSTKDAGC